jgi:hypothetical protein
MINYGIATPQVKLLSSLPNIEPISSYNFFVSAHEWIQYANSPYLKPILLEKIVIDPDTEDPEEGNFAVIFPARRKKRVPNVILSDSEAQAAFAARLRADGDLFFEWKIVNLTEENNNQAEHGIHIPKLLKTLIENNRKTGISDLAGTIDSQVVISGSRTALFKNEQDLYKVSYNDKEILEVFTEYFDLDLSGVENIDENNNYFVITQVNVLSPVWWYLESTPLPANTPFYLTFNRYENDDPKNPVVIVISLGVGTNDRIDVILSNDANPRVIDYGTLDANGEATVKIFPNDFARISDTQRYIEFACMNFGTKICFWVNNQPLIYGRTIGGSNQDISNKPREIQIQAGPIRVWAQNVAGKIHMDLMTFSKYGIMSFTVPEAYDMNGSPIKNWAGFLPDGTTGTSIAAIPNGQDGAFSGVDCAVFEVNSELGVSGLPEDYFGKRIFSDETNGFGSIKIEKFVIDNVYYIKFETYQYSSATDDLAYLYNKAPILYQLRGGATVPVEVEDAKTVDVSMYVMTLSENMQANDYHSANRNASITLYNPGGIFDVLGQYQTGCEISWGYNGSTFRTLTGLVVAASKTDNPGSETITLSVEDYMYILQSNPIVNSPFYDGMVDYYAVKDIARIGGVIEPLYDREGDEYFLPAGYSFTKPAMKFPAQQNLLECITTVCKKFESFVYFDATGRMHFDGLPGGLFAMGGRDSLVRLNQTSDANDSVLDSLTINYSLRDTVSNIVSLTVSRVDRTPMLAHIAAPQNRLLFKKTAYYDEAALGDMVSQQLQIAKIGLRAFQNTREASAKTVLATAAHFTALPFDYMEIAGQKFRIFEINKSYEANQNTCTIEFKGRWGY